MGKSRADPPLSAAGADVAVCWRVGVHARTVRRVLRALRPRLLAGDVVVITFVYACQWLARWQWSRAQRPDGSLQNYVYAVQWLGFGVFGLGLWVVTRIQLLREAGADRNGAMGGTRRTDATRSARVELPTNLRLPSYPALAQPRSQDPEPRSQGPEPRP